MGFTYSFKSLLRFLSSSKTITLDKLQTLSLKEICIPPVTVDGEASLIKFQNMKKGVSWSHEFGSSPELQPVKNAILNFVIVDKTYVERFDFKNIQSFSASKSFMTWSEKANASNYTDALEWGMNMWESDNLAFTTDMDFKKNLAHLMTEGIGHSGVIQLFIYGWHNDRIQWSNSGASHHAAALIRQLNTQNREFFCEAEITHYSIDIDILEALSNDFYLLLSENECFKSDQEYLLNLALSDLGIRFSTCSLPIRSRKYQLLVLPKNQEVIRKNDLDIWISENLAENKLLNFIDFLRKNSQ